MQQQNNNNILFIDQQVHTSMLVQFFMFLVLWALFTLDLSWEYYMSTSLNIYHNTIMTVSVEDSILLIKLRFYSMSSLPVKWYWFILFVLFSCIELNFDKEGEPKVDKEAKPSNTWFCCWPCRLSMLSTLLFVIRPRVWSGREHGSLMLMSSLMLIMFSLIVGRRLKDGDWFGVKYV